MCIANFRWHKCRHCHICWLHSDGFDYCPEGDKLVTKHGPYAPFDALAGDVGHRVSPLTPPTPEVRVSSSAYLEDMCDQCKGKHMREWEAETRQHMQLAMQRQGA